MLNPNPDWQAKSPADLRALADSYERTALGLTPKAKAEHADKAQAARDEAARLEQIAAFTTPVAGLH
jgi:hypothetical protein